MDFAPSARTGGAARPARRLHRRAGRSGGRRSTAEQVRASGDPHFHPPVMEELKAEARGARPLEPVPPRRRATARGSATSSTRRCASSWALTAVAGGHQLLGARHRQHGAAGQVRHAVPARAVPRPAARRRDPLVLRDDRAVGRELRRHQHPEPHRARRRPLRVNAHKWWTSGAASARCTFAILMGVSDPDADRHRRHSMVLVPVRHAGRARSCARSPCSATTPAAATARRCSRTCASRPSTCSARRAAGSRSRRPGSVPAASTTACAPSAWPRRRCGSCASARSSGSRSASRSPTRASIQDADRRESRIEIEQARLLTMKAAWLMDTVGDEGRPLRDRRDQGRRRPARDHGDRPRHPGVRRAPASPTTGRSPRCTRTRARCTSSTVPTRCTCSRSPAASCASYEQFRPGDGGRT